VAQLNNFVASHLGVIGVVIIVGCVVLVLMIAMLFIQSRRIALLSERLDDLTQGADGQSLEGVLSTHLDTVVRVSHELDEVMARTAILEGGARLHFGRLGLVRFNPFDDTGGNQSFALSILDANNDGFVVTSLHSRTGTRLYAKAIFGGTSETTLGSEEAQAVEIAVSQGGGAQAGRSAVVPPGASAGKGAGRNRAVGSAAPALMNNKPLSPAAVPAASVVAVDPPADVPEAAVPEAVSPDAAVLEAVSPDAAVPEAVALDADGELEPTEAGSTTPSA
jgi:hypothetical protein